MLIRNPATGKLHNATISKHLPYVDDWTNVSMKQYEVAGFGNPVTVIESEHERFTILDWNKPQPQTPADIQFNSWINVDTNQLAEIRNGWPVCNMESEPIKGFPNAVTLYVYTSLREDYLTDDDVLGDIQELRDSYVSSTYLTEVANKLKIYFCESEETWADWNAFANIAVSQMLRQVDWLFIAKQVDIELDSLLDAYCD